WGRSAATAAQVGRADARLWQDQLHPARTFPIARERGYDRAHLLIAREHQEGGRASIALHAHDEQVGFRVGKFIDAMRRDRATAMNVGINERSQGQWAFQSRIKGEPDFAQEGEIRAEASCCDDFVNRTNALFFSYNDHALCRAPERLNLDASHQPCLSLL